MTRMFVKIYVIGITSILLAFQAQAGSGGGGSSTFCPCFTSTIIDAEISKAGGDGVEGMLNGTDGEFTCEDTGDAVNLRFNNADRSVNISVFGELEDGSRGPGCGWSGRPLDTTRQEAAECQNQIKQSWAWKVLGCPSL